MHYYLITRFSVLDHACQGWQLARSVDAETYRARLFDPRRMEFKFRVFEAVTLPSIGAQTHRDYTWLIYTSSQLPAPYTERLLRITSSNPRIQVLFVESMKDLDVKRRTTRAPYATIRLDDDDALNEEFLQWLNAYSSRTGVIVSFPRGRRFTLVDGKVRLGKRQDYPKIGLGLTAFGFNILAAGAHTRIDERYEVIYDRRPGAYLMCCSEAFCDTQRPLARSSLQAIRGGVGALVKLAARRLRAVAR